MVASLVYHREWLQEQFPQDHPLFQSRLWKSHKFHALSDRVLTGNFYNKESGMKATGIPSHLIIAHRVNVLEEKMETSQQTNVEHNKVLVEHMEKLPKVLSNQIRDDFKVDDHQMTAADVQRLLNSFRNDIINTLRPGIDASTSERQQISQAAPRFYIGGQVNDDGYRYWEYNGRTHPVPPDFKFPAQIGSKMAWDLFFDGNQSEGIKPYHYIHTYSLVKTLHSRFSKFKKVVSTIMATHFQLNQESITQQEMINTITQLNISDRDAAFRRAFTSLISPHYDEEYNLGGLSYVTVYGKINPRTVRSRVSQNT